MAEKKKRRVSAAPLLACVVILLLVLVAPYYSELTSNKSKNGTDVTISVEQGSSVQDIAGVLKENKLIKSEKIFILRAKLEKKADKLNYGTFELNTGMCIPDIINVLVNTTYKKETVTFTVPEGYSVEQIAERAESLSLCTKEEFFAALDDDYDYSFLNDVPSDKNVKYRLQGFLFPKTYEFYTDASAHDVIDAMLAQFEKEYAAVAENSRLNFYDTITLASLIEREALLNDERPRIAGVMYNRLNKGMRLQIDASVVYVITDGLYDVNRVLYSDLEVDSPYNTYKVSGLPAGPICNPGIVSIKAAINPEENNYLYYHTDTTKNDGSHIFTENYEDHLATMN
jgi:UPF0755 protein